ncbi:MAG: hypothetical protein JNJ46_11845 [Myxococcales bacterium]|nr:hypothetical protein [Myxococcales bacterium]
MRSRLALLALLVIALWTGPGVRAELVVRGPSQLTQRDDHLALHCASKRQSVQSDRRGGSGRHAHSKSGSVALLPICSPRLFQAAAALFPTVHCAPRDGLYRGSRRARAPPSVA